MSNVLPNLNLKTAMQLGCLMLFAMVLPEPAMAAANGMPWEGPIQGLLDSLTGPVARAAGVIAILITGIGFAFSDGGGGMKKILGVVFGLSIAFAAATWGLGFFGFGGGVTV